MFCTYTHQVVKLPARMSRPRDPPDLAQLDLERDIRAPDTKRRYVRSLFDTVESSYDGFTRWFSFGLDAQWKRTLVALVTARAPRAARILDLATGTGDLGAAMLARRPDVSVVGADLSLGMLRHAAKRLGPAARNVIADMNDVPYPSESFDCVTAGYGFRNAPDPRAALAEAHRVLRPGGTLATLDFYVPRSPLWRSFFLGYLRVAGRLAGRLTHGLPQAYGYIAPSLEQWVTAAEFTKQLEALGMVVEVQVPRMLGGIALHVARRLGSRDVSP